MPNSIQKSCPTKKSTKSIGIKGDIIFRTESHTQNGREQKNYILIDGLIDRLKRLYFE